MPHQKLNGRWSARLRLLTFLGTMILVGSVLYFTSGGRNLNPDALFESLRNLHPVTARLSYVAVHTLGTLLFLPGTVLAFVGAVLFGHIEGTLYTWIGACLGATLSFLFSRWMGRALIVRLLGERLKALDAFIENRGFWGILILRLLPVFPFNLINFGSGLTAVRFRDYVLATMIGIVPGTFVYQFLFAKVGRRILTDGIQWKLLQDSELWAPVGLFLLFLIGSSLLGRYYRSTRQFTDSIK